MIVKSFQSHIIKKESILPRNRDSSRTDVMKGGGRGKKRQHAHFLQRQRDISLLVLSPALLYKMLSPQSSVRFCPCGIPWVFYASYKSLTSLTTLECAVWRQARGFTQAKRCLLAKWLNVSSLQISEPTRPRPHY